MNKPIQTASYIWIPSDNPDFPWPLIRQQKTVETALFTHSEWTPGESVFESTPTTLISYKRPKLAQCLHQLAAKQIDLLVVASMDVLADSIIARATLTEAEHPIYCCDIGTNVGEPCGELCSNMTAIIAEYMNDIANKPKPISQHVPDRNDSIEQIIYMRNCLCLSWTKITRSFNKTKVFCPSHRKWTDEACQLVSGLPADPFA